MSVDISVIIPTFRRQGQLAQALASVLGQIGVTFEAFVVDDCPDGSARDVVEQLQDPRINYIRNHRPSGGVPSIVRNLGWPRASGAYVHFLDDDDIVPEGHYAAVKAAFVSHPRIGLVFGRIEPFGDCPEEQLQHERRYFDEAARNAKRWGRLGPRLGFTGWMLFGSALLICSGGVVRRECVVRLGGFDPQIRLMEDAEFYCRVMRTCGAIFLDRVAIHYRIGSPSLMHSPNPPPEQRRQEREGHRLMWKNYCRDHGTFEFFALALLTRTLSKLVYFVSL
jgi:glycosyltransferase involved in cell wall biosynthesis